MCREAVSLIAEALNGVQTADVLLKVERVIAHFMQTMEVCPSFLAEILLRTDQN